MFGLCTGASGGETLAKFMFQRYEMNLIKTLHNVFMFLLADYITIWLALEMLCLCTLRLYIFILVYCFGWCKPDDEVHAQGLWWFCCSVEYDNKFSTKKSAAMQTGSRHTMICEPLELCWYNLQFAQSWKYPGINLISGKTTKLSIDHMKIFFMLLTLYNAGAKEQTRE